MKVIGIVGSPRKKGNTEIYTSHCLRAISEEGLETELITLAGKDLKPCTACMACVKADDCSIQDDLQPIYLKMKEADGIILSSPVYYGSATALIRALMERVGYVSTREGRRTLAGKVGGPLVVARRSGHALTFAQMTLWYQILGLVVPGSTYWSVAFGKEKGEVSGDEEGMRTAWNFGKNVALVVKKLASKP